MFGVMCIDSSNRKTFKVPKLFNYIVRHHQVTNKVFLILNPHLNILKDFFCLRCFYYTNNRNLNVIPRVK